MLWEKEFNSNELYTNYFDRLDQSLADLDAIFNESMPPAKSNEISQRLRNEGNVEFEAKNWSNAILAWNYALCFAELKSDALIQAYGNRSAGYFQLDRFNSSYNDISLALQVPTHSEALKQQLEQHRMDCLDFIDKSIGNDTSSSECMDHTPGLSLAPPYQHTNVNGSFQWLTLEQYEPFQYRFIANADIDVGKTVWTESALVSKLMSDQYLRCTVCFAKNDNLIPCSNCTAAMFCQGSCQYSTLHMAECNLNTELNEDGKLQLLIRTILYAISLFNDVDDLMEFVKQTVMDESKSDDQRIVIDELAKYRQFLKVKSCQDILSGKKPDPMIYFAFKAIMQSQIGEIFGTVKRQRFLTHLIWKHQATISLGYVHQHTNEFKRVQSLGIYPQFSQFKHQCTPNAMYYLTGNKLVIVTLTPIKQGEEIFVSYFGKTAILYFCDNKERIEQLRSLNKCFGQICGCTFCGSSKSDPSKRKIMKNDRLYQCINRICNRGEDGFWTLKQSLTKPRLSEARQQAIEFLQKYGRLTWCKEIVKIVACYMDIIWLDSESNDDLNEASH